MRKIVVFMSLTVLFFAMNEKTWAASSKHPTITIVKEVFKLYPHERLGDNCENNLHEIFRRFYEIKKTSVTINNDGSSVVSTKHGYYDIRNWTVREFTFAFLSKDGSECFSTAYETKIYDILKELASKNSGTWKSWGYTRNKLRNVFPQLWK